MINGYTENNHNEEQMSPRTSIQKSGWKMQVKPPLPGASYPQSPQNNCHLLPRCPALVKTTRRNVSWRLIKRFFRLIKMIIDQVGWRGLTLEHIRKLMGVLELTLHQTSHTGLAEKMCRDLVKLFYSIVSFWAHFIDQTSSLTWRHDEEWLELEEDFMKEWSDGQTPTLR